LAITTSSLACLRAPKCVGRSSMRDNPLLAGLLAVAEAALAWIGGGCLTKMARAACYGPRVKDSVRTYLYGKTPLIQRVTVNPEPN
jgi:hypothetical protein